MGLARLHGSDLPVRFGPREWVMPAAALVFCTLGCVARDKTSGAQADRATEVPAAPARANLPPAAKTDTRKPAPSRAPRDSAFGPRMDVDSTGKVTPIRKKP